MVPVSGWCHDRGTPALPAPPALVAVYLSALAGAGKIPPTIGRALAAIAHTHKRAGYTPPHRAPGGQVVAEVLAGIRRSRATPPQREAPAALAAMDQESRQRLFAHCVGSAVNAVHEALNRRRRQIGLPRR